MPLGVDPASLCEDFRGWEDVIPTDHADEQRRFHGAGEQIALQEQKEQKKKKQSQGGWGVWQKRSCCQR